MGYWNYIISKSCHGEVHSEIEEFTREREKSMWHALNLHSLCNTQEVLTQITVQENNTRIAFHTSFVCRDQIHEWNSFCHVQKVLTLVKAGFWMTHELLPMHMKSDNSTEGLKLMSCRRQSAWNLTVRLQRLCDFKAFVRMISALPTPAFSML